MEVQRAHSFAGKIAGATVSLSRLILEKYAAYKQLTTRSYIEKLARRPLRKQASVGVELRLNGEAAKT
jgi:hypothetical protein